MLGLVVNRVCWPPGRQVTMTSLRGMGGVGKTALAARLAYQLREHFSDGVLWARLDTSDTLSVLAAFAAAYGQDVSPHRDVAGRAAAVRGILAGKRVLIVLDNAEESAQIRPLLPPSTGQIGVIIWNRLSSRSRTRTKKPEYCWSWAAVTGPSASFAKPNLSLSAANNWRPG